MDYKEVIGCIGGFLTTVSMVPQVYKMFKSMSAFDISMTFSLLFTVGIAFWLAYGVLYGLISVIVWNATALVLGVGMVYGKVKWG